MQVKLKAEPRTEKGKERARKLRREGRIPAVLYGHEFEPQLLSLDGHEFTSLLRRRGGLHGLLELEVEGAKEGRHTVVIKEVQKHPIKDNILHVDFQRVKETEKIHADVPLRYVGEPAGVKLGGLLQHFLYEVRVEALPRDLPEFIELDISGLKLGQTLKVSDLPQMPGVHYLNSPDENVVMVIARRVKTHLIEVEEEEAAEGGAEAAAGAAPEAAEAGEEAVAGEAQSQEGGEAGQPEEAG
jgi:large subunit ribosomal protein L25